MIRRATFFLCLCCMAIYSTEQNEIIETTERRGFHVVPAIVKTYSNDLSL